MNKFIESTNPAKNYSLVGNVAISADSEISEKVKNAGNARQAWKELGIRKRIRTIYPIFEEFQSRKKEFSAIITKEIGKPIKESEMEMREALDKYFKWFLENGETALSNEIVFSDSKNTHEMVFEPLGTVAVITPWNFPFEMFVWGVIPNLIAGNTVIFKISEECPMTGRLIEEIMESNLPKGVFSEVYGAGDIGEKLANDRIDCIWFTGSSKTGRKLYNIAAGKFIKAVLEMGGSNAGIIFEDADIDAIIGKLYAKRFANCGQTCDALKRLLVHKSKFSEVEGKLKKEVESKIVGDPENPKTDLGSLVAKRQLELLEQQIDDAVKKGAKVITGGKRPERLNGAFYCPTILTNISPHMRVWKEEVFGPALPIMTFETEEEAIKLANSTNYGLGAIVFTKDSERSKRAASRLAVGTIEINSSSHWNPSSPFGGYKQSGMGREHGLHGFRELCQIKLIAQEKK